MLAATEEMPDMIGSVASDLRYGVGFPNRIAIVFAKRMSPVPWDLTGLIDDLADVNDREVSK